MKIKRFDPVLSLVRVPFFFALFHLLSSQWRAPVFIVHRGK